MSKTLIQLRSTKTLPAKKNSWANSLQQFFASGRERNIASDFNKIVLLQWLCARGKNVLVFNGMETSAGHKDNSQTGQQFSAHFISMGKLIKIILEFFSPTTHFISRNIFKNIQSHTSFSLYANRMQFARKNYLTEHCSVWFNVVCKS